MQTTKDLVQFGERIGLAPEALQQALAVGLGEAEYLYYRRLFFQNREALYRMVMQRPDGPQWMLAIFLRLCEESWQRAAVSGISAEVCDSTFSDLAIWSRVCKARTGKWGLLEQIWLEKHVDGLVYRLGRLQFEIGMLPGRSEAGAYCFPSGTLALHVHVPEGSPLVYEECRESYRRALAFFKGVRPVFFCHSWLLYPGLSAVLPEDSNILRFQRDFTLLGVDDTERQAEDRIWGMILETPADYPAKTRLQQAARRHLMEGGKLGAAWGVILDGLDALLGDA